MATIGIIGAMEQEIVLLKDKMELQKEWTTADAHFYEGQLEGHHVFLVRCGVGKVNAAVTTTLLLADHDLDYVINTGSAGGLGENLHIGDVVVSSELAYHDVDATAFDYVLGQVPGMPARYQADSFLTEKAITSASATGLNPVKGLIVSSDSFIAGKKETERIKGIFPEVLASEMEGAAIAQVAYMFRVPFVVIRALSDTASEEAGVDFNIFIEQAGKDSAALVLHLLKNLS